MPVKKTRNAMRRKAKARARKTRRKQKGGWFTCGSKGCVQEPVPRVAAAAPPSPSVTPAVEENDGTEPVRVNYRRNENNSMVPLKKPENNASEETGRKIRFRNQVNQREIVPRGKSEKTGPVPSLTKRTLSTEELTGKMMAYPYRDSLPYLP